MNHDNTATRLLAPVVARRPPLRQRAAWAWLRRQLWGDSLSLGISVALALAAVWLVPDMLAWGLQRAVWVRDSELCRAVSGQGACWGVVAEKYRAILFGRYPFAEHWRAAWATGLLLGGVVLTCALLAQGRLTGRRLVLGWSALFALVLALLRGGWGGLPVVDSTLWSGLPLSLLLSIGILLGAAPLAVVLALGRRSSLPLLSRLCTFYIEVVRAVPSVSILLLAAFLLPLLFPRGVSLDMLWRVWGGLVLFAAAYLAEVLRGGLQSIPRGQIEAAQALGLSYWQIQTCITLPQAVRVTLPALMNSAISIFKETSLVTVVSVFELTGALNLALAGDLAWREFYLEAYLFVALLYWVGCAALSAYSRRLARTLAVTG